MNEQATVERVDLMGQGAGGMFAAPLYVVPSPANALFAARVAAWRPGVLPRHPDETDDDDESLAGIAGES